MADERLNRGAGRVVWKISTGSSRQDPYSGVPSLSNMLFVPKLGNGEAEIQPFSKEQRFPRLGRVLDRYREARHEGGHGMPAAFPMAQREPRTG